MNKRTASIEAPGQDSFLDVVANLVGILIILIMVLGVQARAAYIRVQSNHNDENFEQEKQEVLQLQQSADAIEQDINALAVQLSRLQFEVAYREKEREKALQIITLLEQQLEKEKQQLDSEARQRLERKAKIAELENELEQLDRQRHSLELVESQPSIIEHLPTPMAKTVFGKELHLRLLGGRITVIAWDQIVEALKQHAQQQVWKLREVPSLTEEVGPVGGFRIRYTLHVVDHSIETKVGPVVQKRVELDHFDLVPTSDQLGEPFEQALQPQSQFSAHLGLADPRTTTVTVWVYPDSFDHFRQLRSFLYKKGFLTAARPMPEGQLIGGSPYGSRSQAQ